MGTIIIEQFGSAFSFLSEGTFLGLSFFLVSIWLARRALDDEFPGSRENVTASRLLSLTLLVAT